MENIEFLQEIYKIVEVGIIGINDVIDKVKKEDFREYLDKEKQEYKKIKEKCLNILIKYGEKEHKINNLIKLNSKIISIKANDNQKITEMMIRGTNKAIIKIREAMDIYDDSDEEITLLAEELLLILESNKNDLKIYL